MRTPHHSLLIALLVMNGGAPASAQISGLPGQLQACMGIFGAMARLACYDRVANAIASQGNGATGASGISPAQPAPVKPSPGAGSAIVNPGAQAGIEQFGSEHIQQPATAPLLNSLSAAVVNTSFGPQGRFVVTLSNGQTWRQIQGDTAVPNLRRKARSATITRGAFGSYNLSFSDQAGRYKVERVQ
jgi:hypothetical protein